MNIKELRRQLGWYKGMTVREVIEFWDRILAISQSAFG